MKPDLSIVIPTRNGLHLLRENLPSVQYASRVFKERTGGAVEIIVVDDGSQDGTSEMLPGEFPEVYLVQWNRSRGFACACNAGFEACRFPVVSLLNNDVQIEEEFFLHQVRHFQDGDVFGVTAKVFEWDRPLFAAGGRVGRFRKGFWSVYFNYDLKIDASSRWVEEGRLLSAYAIGGFSAYSREKLQILGGFNELLSPIHWEDVDLSYRAWKRGWEVRYEPRSVARHRTSATINAHFNRRSVERISYRNRLLFHWINLHSPTYLLRHLFMLILLFFTKILVLDFVFYAAMAQAVGNLGAVRRLRRVERAESKRSDKEISRLLAAFYRSAPIQIYYNQEDVKERHPESGEEGV